MGGKYNGRWPLFLADAEFPDPSASIAVPVIDGWEWRMSGTGKGCLKGPDGAEHCQFDLVAATVAFEPDLTPTFALGLTPGLVQEMGEKYARDVLFTEDEKAAYEKYVPERQSAKRAYSRDVYDSLRGVIQLEYQGGEWVSHIDTERAMELTGIEYPPILSGQKGIAAFGQMTERLHAYPLRDPDGYMALKGNLYEFIHTEYRNQYENTLQAIDNNIVEGTGYGVEAVLNKLQSTVRKNITQDCLPEGEYFGTLRFVKATDESKAAVKDFVKWRVDKTLIFERKRSYERDTIERSNTKYRAAADRIKGILTVSMCGEEALEM